MQRQYNVGLGISSNTNAGTISLAVDKNRLPRLGLPRGPERAWPGDSDILRNRRLLDDKSGFKPPPRYSPAYTSNVSHLVV